MGGTIRGMILVSGATGLNGRALVRRLSAGGTAVRALTRTASRAADLAALPYVEVVEGDLGRPETLVEPLRGVDRAMLISSSDATMFDVQAAFIDAAARAGVAHVVKLSGIMPELDSPFRFARMHGEAEQHLERSGMAYTHLRAGEFMASYFRQVRSIAADGTLRLPMADARIASIDVDDIAEVAARTLTESGHEGRTSPLTGPEALSMAEVAQKLAVVVGKPITYVDVDPAEAKQRSLAAGIPPYLADGLEELFAERRRGKESHVFPDAAALLGRRPTSFDAFAARNAAIFRGDR